MGVVVNDVGPSAPEIKASPDSECAETPASAETAPETGGDQLIADRPATVEEDDALGRSSCFAASTVTAARACSLPPIRARPGHV